MGVRPSAANRPMASPPLLSWKFACKSTLVPPDAGFWFVLLSAQTRRKPRPVMNTLVGICHFVGTSKLSVRNRPERLTALVFGLNNSNQSWNKPSAESGKPPGPLLSAIHSLMTTGRSAPGPVLVTTMAAVAPATAAPC